MVALGFAAVSQVLKGNVTIIGGGVAGQAATETAFGLGANVTVLDTNIQTLENINQRFGKGLTHLCRHQRT